MVKIKILVNFVCGCGIGSGAGERRTGKTDKNMILDSLKNCALYENVNPRMKKAFALIASTDWTKMEPGIHELDGKDIYVNVMERELKRKPDAKLEVHNEYIDIQVLVTGKEESFGWSERRELKLPQGEFDAAKDTNKGDKK